MRARISFIVVSLLTLISCFFYIRNIEYKNPCQSAVLEGLTPEENRSLSRMCRGLLYNSSLGYTLFGDKPASFISVYGASRISDDQSFFQKKLISIVRMCRQPIESSCFAIVFEKSGNSDNIYLINKKAFLSAVKENLSLFQTFLEKRITPQELLQDVLKRGFSETIQGSHALFGIVLGFGRQNALNFDRSYLLYSSLDGIPPWKETRGTRCLLPKSKDFFLQERLRAIALKENNIQPTPPFTTIQEELDNLDSKLLPIPGEGGEACASASIPLPAFACDQRAQETQALIQKYMTQKTYLETICNNDDLFEIAVNKFLKDD